MDITTGSDGNLWFSEDAYFYLGKTTPAGVTTTYTIPQTTYGAYGNFTGVTLGPDGNIWATDIAFPGLMQIVKATPDGNLSTFPIGNNLTASAITTGPEGNLWFTSQDNVSGNVILDRMATTGNLIQFPVSSQFSNPKFIVTGPDNNLWFTEFGTFGKNPTGGKIARATPSGGDNRVQPARRELRPVGNHSRSRR